MDIKNCAKKSKSKSTKKPLSLKDPPKYKQSSKPQISRENSWRVGKIPEAESSISDFVSDDSDEEQPSEETDEFKMYKKRVLKRILKNFDLEETIHRNSKTFSVSYFFEEKDFSVESSLHAAALKQRLIHLMGTNEVRINDRSYAEKLRQKLWEEYEADLDRAEEQRAEGERLRMRRLLKQGVISLDELKEDPLFLKEYRRQKAKYGRANPQRPKSPSRKRAQTAPPTSDSRPRPHHNPLTTMPSHFPSPASTQGSRPHTAVYRSRQERPKTVQWERRPYQKLEKQEEEDEPYSGRIRPMSLYKYEHPQIKELREEETVDGLYALAEDILDGKLPSQRQGQTTSKKPVVLP